MHLELISFPLCPFVQRSVILLKYKQADFQITHIDLKNKPQWFLDISPMGKVPVLRVNSTTAIFESSVINEFIDETLGPRLMVKDPLQRAIERGLIEYSSDLLMRSYKMTMEKDPSTLEKLMGDFFLALSKIEPMVQGEPYFKGAQFSLVDAAWAPLWTRVVLSEKLKTHPQWNEIPQTQKWAFELATMPEVLQSLPENFNTLYIDFCRQQGSLLY